jgi:hypothetical protein
VTEDADDMTEEAVESEALVATLGALLVEDVTTLAEDKIGAADEETAAEDRTGKIDEEVPVTDDEPAFRTEEIG